MRSAAWIGLGVGAGVVAGLASLLNRVLRPAREARLYVDEAHAATQAVERQLAGLGGLAESARHAGRLAADLSTGGEA